MTRPATGAQTSVYFVLETETGVTPDNPVWTKLRFTGSLPALTRDNLESAELDGSREKNNIRLGQYSVAGDINVELYYGAFDELLEGLMQGSWVAGSVDSGVEITVDASANTFTRTTGDFTAIFSEGDTVKFGSLVGSGNSDPVVITSVTATVITAAAATLTDESATTTDVTQCDTLKVGTDIKSFSLLYHYADLNDGAGGYDLVTGCEVTAMGLEVSVNNLVTGSFSVIGRNYEQNASLPSGSTFNDANTSRPFASFDGSLVQDGDQIGFVTSISPSMDNAAEAVFVVGSRGASHISYARMSNTFDIEAFFQNYDLFDKFVSEEEGSMQALLKLDGNGFSIRYPRFMYTAGTPEVTGDTDISISASGQALKDADAGTSLILQRIS